MYGDDSSGEVTGRQRVEMACATEPSRRDRKSGVMQGHLESHPAPSSSLTKSEASTFSEGSWTGSWGTKHNRPFGQGQRGRTAARLEGRVW